MADGVWSAGDFPAKLQNHVAALVLKSMTKLPEVVYGEEPR
jgi:hypothetical protein